MIELEILENESTNDFKNRIEKLTNVPSKRQRILCKKLWKGPLKDVGGTVPLVPGTKIVLFGSPALQSTKEKSDSGVACTEKKQVERSTTKRGEVNFLDLSEKGGGSPVVDLQVRKKGASVRVRINVEKTFGDLKRGLEVFAGASADLQRLIHRGKTREDTESILSAGIKKSGAKILLLFRRGKYELDEEAKIKLTVEQKIAKFESFLSSVESRAKHRLFDRHSLALEMAVVEDRLGILIADLSKVRHGDECSLETSRCRLSGLEARAELLKAMALKRN